MSANTMQRTSFLLALTCGVILSMYASCGQADSALVTTEEDNTLSEVPDFDKLDGLHFLKDIRSSMGFPKLSLEEQQEILGKALLFTSHLYVNDELGKQKAGVSLTEDFNSLKSRLGTLATPEFHHEMSSIFLKQEDGHLIYTFPRPHRCFTSQIPIEFDFASSESGERLVVVSEVSEEVPMGEIGDLVLETLRSIRAGQIVESYNGTPVMNAVIKTRIEVASGNQSAEDRKSLALLTKRAHVRDKLPEQDHVTLRIDGVDVSLPWVVKASPWCLENTEDDVLKAEGEYRLESSEIQELEPLDENVKFSVIETSEGRAGLMSIERFRRGRLSLQDMVEGIERAFSLHFKETDLVVIDLRGNGGGDFILSQRLPELFSQKPVEHIHLRTKATPENVVYFESYLKDSVVPFVQQAIEREEPFTVDYRFDQDDPIDEQFLAVTDKPIALLTDALCFSACEAFVATMIDNGLATLFLENSERTGGGGATVIDHSWTSSLYQDRIPGYGWMDYGTDFYVAHEQHVRVGLNRGLLVESVGIQADHVVTRTVESFEGSIENYWEELMRVTLSSQGGP